MFSHTEQPGIALRTSVERRSLSELKRFIDEAPQLPGRYQIFAPRSAPIPPEDETFFPGPVGLDELAQCRRVDRLTRSVTFFR